MFGCIDDAYLEYNPLANTDDGSCITLIIVGCMDDLACNYNILANVDDDSCIFLDINSPCDYCSGEIDGTGVIVDGDLDDDGICNMDDPCPNDPLNDGDGDGICDDIDPCPGDPINDPDGDGVCDVDEVYGCTDDTACNYDELATEENDSCFYAIGCDYCSGETDGTGTIVDGDVDNDGVCDYNEIFGCDDSSACNYDDTATENDDSCEYPEDLYPDDLYDANNDGVLDTSYLDCDGNCLSDLDEDGICDQVDNCPTVFNPNQEDEDDPGGAGDACDGIGLEEDDSIVFQVYPNPVNSVLNVDYGSNILETVDVKLFNSVGQVVFSSNYVDIKDFNLQINVQDFSSGIYQLKLITPSYNSNKLIIVN